MFAGTILAILSAVIWSGNFILARGLSQTVPPVTLCTARWVIGFLCVLPLALPKLREDWPIIRKHWFYLSMLGLTGITLLNTFYYIGGKTTGTINMSIIATSTPIYIMILSRIFNGEPLEGRRMCGLAATMAGVLILISKGDLAHITNLRVTVGDLWAVGGATMFGVYSYLVRGKPKNLSPAGFVASTFALGTILLIPLQIWELYNDYNFVISGLSNHKVWLAILYAGVFCSFICFYMWNEAIRRIGPVMASIIYNTLPVFAAIGAMIFLDEQLSAAQAAGSVLVIGGILFATVHPETLFHRPKK